jgi:hypothetical protein
MKLQNCKIAHLPQSDSGFVTVFFSFFSLLPFFVVSRPQHAQPVFVICFCWLLTFFFTKKETFLSLNVCSLVKADSAEKERNHECNEATQQKV